MKTPYIFFFILALVSCSNHNEEVVKTIKELSSHQMVIPFEKLHCINARHTIDDSKRFKKAEYKIIDYIDEKSCAPCTIKGLVVWNELLYLNKKISSAIIIEAPSSRIDLLQETYLESGLDHPVYIDTCSAFRKVNTFITDNSLFHTFLLNSKDSICLIGNPFLNENIKKLYKKILLDQNE